MGKLSIEVYEEDWYKFITFMKKLGTSQEQIAFHEVMKRLYDMECEEGQE